MKSLHASLLLTLLTGLFSVAPVAAQADEIELTRAGIRDQRQTMVTQYMRLTPEESQRFWPLYRSYQAEMRTLGDKVVKLIKDYAANYERLSDRQAEKILDRSLKLDEEELKLKRKYLPRFRKILPPKKVTRYYQLENQLDAVVRYNLAGSIPLVE